MSIVDWIVYWGFTSFLFVYSVGGMFEDPDMVDDANRWWLRFTAYVSVILIGAGLWKLLMR